MNNPREIAILGGGFTGLVAALRLAESGHKVRVFEKSPDLGGLAASFRIGSEPLEKAYHHLFRTDDCILKLIDELGLSDRLEWHESSVAIYRDGRIWPFMTPLDLLRFQPSSVIGRFRLGLTALMLKYRKRWEPLVEVPALKWMRRYCGSSATRAVWEPLLKGKFSDYADRVSMAWLWARLHIRANSREPGGGKERLGYINGGFIEIINALECRLKERGVICQKGIAAQSIHNGTRGPEIQFDDGSRIEFDAAVFTGSNRALNSLLPVEIGQSEPRGLPEGVNYLGAICLVFATDQKLGDHYWVNVNDENSPFLVMIRHTRLIPAERYGRKEIYYLGAYLRQDGAAFNMGVKELEKEWFRYLQSIFPDFRAENVQETHCFKFRDAQHVATVDYLDYMPSRETSVKGLFLANFSQIFPEDRGTNFAVRDGDEIAARVSSFFI